MRELLRVGWPGLSVEDYRKAFDIASRGPVGRQVKDTPLAGFSYVQVLKVDVAAVAAHLTQLERTAVVASASTGQGLVTSAFLRKLGTVGETLGVAELLVLRVGASGTTKADKAMGRPNEQFVEDENRNVIVGTTFEG